VDVGRFYLDVLHALGEHAERVGTASGPVDHPCNNTSGAISNAQRGPWWLWVLRPYRSTRQRRSVLFREAQGPTQRALRILEWVGLG
jgi:hypothetical protein